MEGWDEVLLLRQRDGDQHTGSVECAVFVVA